MYRYEGTLARLLSAAKPYGIDVKTRWGIDFYLRVGINTGLAVVGEVGSEIRCRVAVGNHGGRTMTLGGGFRRVVFVGV